ncbi:type IV secretion system protein [Vibrio vulnificus]|uniref:type IV secretion system protein n=1 Tax=Vibrio vulnificus TaxID=672 RepID=UPI004057D489
MKKYLLVASLFFTPVVSASGIPVVDIASLTQMAMDNIAKAQQWAREAKQWATENNIGYDQLNQMHTEYKHYKKMVEGHYSFEDIMNDPKIMSEMEEWRTLYDQFEDAEELREEFGINRNDDSMDEMLRKYRMVDRFYERSLKRNQTLMKLLEEFETADSPAKKADLANAIAFEQTKVKNDEQMMASLDKIKQQEADIRHSFESKKKINTLFGDGIPRK